MVSLTQNRKKCQLIITNEDLTPYFSLENKKDRKYWIRLSKTIEHFNLPIDTWHVGEAAY
jgi:hypothetical protein